MWESKFQSLKIFGRGYFFKPRIFYFCIVKATVAFDPQVAGLNPSDSIAIKVANVGNSINAPLSSWIIEICQDSRLVRVSHPGEALHTLRC